jgi:glyoxylase-like metal-dependent hydrolase (beta-lactamase superfamily II)
MLLALASAPAFAEDARSVIAESSKAMGLTGVTSLYYYGAGAQYSLGQNNNSNGPWPKTPVNDYTRAIDFNGLATRATWTTFASPVTGGPAVLGNGQQSAAPNAAWAQQLEIWITPWGFIKGAEANGATLATRSMNGKRYRVLTWKAPVQSPGGKNYQLTGYINANGLVERVETLLDHNVYGDMLVEAEYTFWRDNNGFKFPSEMVQKRHGWPVFDLQVLGAWPNPSKIVSLMASPAPAGGARGGGPPGGAPARGGGAGAAQAADASEKLADGVYRIRGAYNSLAVEFADHVVLVEPGPQSEARTLQGIDEVKKLFPNKPIRYGVPTHHHIDHTGGIAAAASTGMTIVTPELNKAYFEKALNAPRTLAPDALSKSGVKPKVEGFKGDKRVFSDATRTLEIHVIKGLPHADGIVVAWLPKEKILVYADMFNYPPANAPVPDPPVVGTEVFMREIERLGFDQPGTRILSIHNMNPDKLVTVQEIRDSLGSNKL